MKEKLVNLVTASVAVILSLLVAEMASRVAFGVPVFHVEDFRFTQTIRDTMPSIADYDALLGWHLNPHVHVVGNQNGADLTFSTIDYGIRKNTDSDNAVRIGSVLVIGSSFAAGSEVTDEASFPAQLETIIGAPVVNGAVGGFGVDQIVLRAEQLLPIVQPRTLIVDLSTSNITYASFSEAGLPKPYYTIERGALVLHNSPVPTFLTGRDRFEFVKRIAGYSYAINRIMGRFFPDNWFTDKRTRVTRINNDPAAVSCLLLTRLNQEARAAGVARILLSVQHGGGEVTAWTHIPGDLATVEDCARDLSLEIVDEFDAMKALLKADPAKFAQEYVLEQPSHLFGHKSSEGNLHVAERLAAELAKSPPPAHVPAKIAQPFVPGDGVNLLPPIGALQSNRIATVTELAHPGDEGSYVLKAAGENSEHYIVAPAEFAVGGGPLTLSLEADLSRSPRLRLQIISSQGDGVIGDFDLANLMAWPDSEGRGRQIHAEIARPASGWVPLTLGVTLPEATTPEVIFDLVTDTDATNFLPAGQTIGVRHIKLERGQTATAYQVSIIPGDGVNLLPNDGALNSNAIATTTALAQDDPPQGYRLEASTGKSEHYIVASAGSSVGDGPLILSLEARPDPGTRIWLQVVSPKGDGGIGFFDLDRETTSTQRLGHGNQAYATIAHSVEGWSSLALGITLPEPTTPSVILQLTSANGENAFAPAGEAVDVRHIKLERGQTATPYALPAIENAVLH